VTAFVAGRSLDFSSCRRFTQTCWGDSSVVVGGTHNLSIEKWTLKLSVTYDKSSFDGFIFRSEELHSANFIDLILIVDKRMIAKLYNCEAHVSEACKMGFAVTIFILWQEDKDAKKALKGRAPDNFVQVFMPKHLRHRGMKMVAKYL